MITKGDYIIITERDDEYRHIPLEVLGINYQPYLAVVRAVNSTTVFSVELEEVQCEQAGQEYVQAFLDNKPTQTNRDYNSIDVGHFDGYTYDDHGKNKYD